MEDIKESEKVEVKEEPITSNDNKAEYIDIYKYIDDKVASLMDMILRTPEPEKTDTEEKDKEDYDF